MSTDPAAGDHLRVTVNGDEHVLPSRSTVAALVAAMGFEPRGIAVAVDGEVVPRRTWSDRTLRAGEQVEILTIAQGG